MAGENLIFSASFRGNVKLRRTVDKIAIGIDRGLLSGRLESLIVKRVKARFAPPGTTKAAQRTPSGQPWKPLVGQTKRRRRL